MNASLLLIGGEDHNLRIPLMNALRSLGHRVIVAGSGDPNPFQRAGFEFHGISFNRFLDIRSDWRARRALAKLLVEVSADVAHPFDTKLSLLVAFAARANPRTAIVRTINGRGWTFSSRSPAALALRAAYLGLQRLASSSTDALVFEHRWDQKFFERYRLIGPCQSVLIRGAGIDIAGFERAMQTGPSPEDLRREFGLQGAEVITTVTRVTKQKGIPTLLAAAELVHRVRPSVRFLIVGPRESEGPFGVRDDEIKRHAPYVIATGMRPDVPSMLAMSDIFAFPSEYAEGVPRALMEAALCARPIVATDIPGCREVITDGWNGTLAPLRSPRELADKILDLLGDREKAAQMAARGPDVVRDSFSLESVAAEHSELYRRVSRTAQSMPTSEFGPSDARGPKDLSLASGGRHSMQSRTPTYDGH